MADETLLEGGFTNAGRVTRVGDTVRRPARPTTPATKALLDHLERAGFDGAPRFLGIDDRGREVLSYVPGEAAVEPVPEWAFRDEALVSVAELLRRYHAAAASFDATRHAWPLALPAGFRGGDRLPQRPEPRQCRLRRRPCRRPHRLRSGESGLRGVGCGLRRPALGAPARCARRARRPAWPHAGAVAHVRRRLRHVGGRPWAGGGRDGPRPRLVLSRRAWRPSPPDTSRSGRCGTRAVPVGRSALASWLANHDDEMRTALDVTR